MSLDFEILPILFCIFPLRSPQFITSRMSIHYFSPSISLLFTNQKVTNWIANCYFSLRNSNECLSERNNCCIFALINAKAINMLFQKNIVKKYLARLPKEQTDHAWNQFKSYCPDLMIDGELYEYEGFEKPWNIKKVSRMFTHGLKQSDRLIINNTKGCSDRYLRRQIADRLNIKMAIAEVWVYEKGRKRLFFKDGIFYKNNREDNPPCDATYRSTR